MYLSSFTCLLSLILFPDCLNLMRAMLNNHREDKQTRSVLINSVSHGTRTELISFYFILIHDFCINIYRYFLTRFISHCIHAKLTPQIPKHADIRLPRWKLACFDLKAAGSSKIQEECDVMSIDENVDVNVDVRPSVRYVYRVYGSK